MAFNALELTSRGQLLRGLARQAGEITLRYFQHPELRVERKADRTPVTAADREAEQHLRREITAAFPTDGVIGEEFGAAPGTSGFTWILDPIDGTKSFICGVPLYGTMIGLVHDKTSVAGAIYLPALGEGIHATRGEGAWCYRRDEPPRPARVSSTARLEDAVFLTSEVRGYQSRGALPMYQELENRCLVTRTWGDCYGYYLVATGRADLMLDPVMEVWDAAGLPAILHEAGGAFTNWSGEPSIHDHEGLAANPALLEAALEITRAWPRRP